MTSTRKHYQETLPGNITQHRGAENMEKIQVPESVKAHYSREDYKQALEAAKTYLIKDMISHPYLSIHMVCIISVLKEKLNELQFVANVPLKGTSTSTAPKDHRGKGVLPPVHNPEKVLPPVPERSDPPDPPSVQEVDVLFSHKEGSAELLFVEAEDSKGKGVSIGEWREEGEYMKWRLYVQDHAA